jgi:hypothetical protein
MEPDGSLPGSQEPATYPYPEPDQSSPRHPNKFNLSHEEIKFTLNSGNVCYISIRFGIFCLPRWPTKHVHDNRKHVILPPTPGWRSRYCDSLRTGRSGIQTPVGRNIFSFPHRNCGPPSLMYNRYWVFPGAQSGRGVVLRPTHPHHRG